MKSRRALCMFLVGLALVGICIRVQTGISVAYSKGENGGLSAFVTYRVNQILCGEKFSVDIFFNPVGYIFMYFGLKQLDRQQAKNKMLLLAQLVAFIASIVSFLLPLCVEKNAVLTKMWIVTYVIEGCALLIIITSFVNVVKSKVDAYYNMEVGKDLVFATELFAFAYFAIILMVFADAIALYFSRYILVLDYIAIIYSILYFIYKMSRYNNKLKIFE